MSKYSKLFSPKATPQSEPMLGREAEQVANNAGGFVFKLDKWGQLDRFLILGTAAGSYYAAPQKLTRDAAKCVLECLAEDAERTVKRIVEIDTEARAPKKDPALFALALACAYEGHDVRKHGYVAIPHVCRTAGHLLEFVALLMEWRGWSRGLRTAIGRWYTEQTADRLAYQVVKYRERGDKANRWTHHDILRQCHPTPKDEDQARVFDWICGRDPIPNVLPRFIVGFQKIRDIGSAAGAAHLVKEYTLPREAVPTEYLNSPEVWAALFPPPATAMLRGLAQMTTTGFLKPLSKEAAHIVECLDDPTFYSRSRIHPLQVLMAARAYGSGGHQRSFSGREAKTYEPVQTIVRALDAGFVKAFKAVEPTGKNIYLALDVSVSMTAAFIANTNLSAREASAAMSMVTMATEKNWYAAGFAGRKGARMFERGSDLIPLKINPSMSLDQVCKTMADLPFGGTDCALPMLDAMQKGMHVDAFVVYTDNETWAGNIHPVEALRQYRQRFNPKAKLIVVGMTATAFTIADPNDMGMMDVVGFDSSAPSIIADFIRA